MDPTEDPRSLESFIYYVTFYVEPDLYWNGYSSMHRRPDGPDEPARLPHSGDGTTGYGNPDADRLLEAYREEPGQQAAGWAGRRCHESQ